MSKAPAWIARSQGQVAQFFGVNSDTVKRWRREGMPGAGQSYDLAQILHWLRTAGPWRPRPPGEALEEGEAESPALERYRLARAAREEWAHERDLGLWLSRDLVHEAFGGIAAALRSAGDLLALHCGEEAQRIHGEALDEAQRRVEQLLGPEAEAEDLGADDDP